MMGRYRSGQTGETVNLLAYAFSGSNPLLPNLLGSTMVVHSAVNRRVAGSSPARAALCQSRIVVDCAGFVNRIRKDTSVRIRSLADFAPMV